MSEKHLERKEVLNLVYTQQADAMANAYARLKAEVELWKLRSDNWQKFCQLTRPEMTDELNRLKAEVERLTKAGDELWEFAKLADTNAPKARRKALKDWNAAKEGKQP
jgi:hypothetical protein